MVRAVLLGPPGSGKSTQAAMIADYYSVPIVSPGALLRAAVRNRTDIGRQADSYLKRGDLVPNHLVDQLVFGRLGQADCEKSFVLDGFPRSLEQAESLDRFMEQQRKRLSAVLFFEAPDEVIVQRLSARRICQVCGAIYSLVFNAPQTGDICNTCHSRLTVVASALQCEACRAPFEQREDDKPEVIERRLQVQRRALKPVLAHFRSLGLLVTIDATRSPEQVFADILAVLGEKQRQAGGS